MEQKRDLKSEVKVLAEAGCNTREISEKLGICCATVKRKLSLLGIKPNRGLSRIYSLNSAPEDLKQLVLGSILGDGSFVKASPVSFCMSIAHAERQLKYLQIKDGILKKYKLSGGISKYTQYDKRHKHYYTVYKLKSRTNNLFKEVRQKFYSLHNKSIVDTEVFNELSPLGLAIWYLDDGYVTPSSCIFSTVSIPIETQEKLAEILLKKFDLHFTVGKNDNSMYLYHSDFDKFKNLIVDYVPEDLHYKLVPYRQRVLDKSDELLESCDANQQPSLESA